MKIKTSKGDRTFQVINILIFAIFAIICAYPFYYLPSWITCRPIFQNYVI